MFLGKGREALIADFDNIFVTGPDFFTNDTTFVPAAQYDEGATEKMPVYPAQRRFLVVITDHYGRRFLAVVTR